MDEAREQMQSIGNDSEQVISKHHVSHWQVFSKLVPRAELVYPILVGSVEEKQTLLKPYRLTKLMYPWDAL